MEENHACQGYERQQQGHSIPGRCRNRRLLGDANDKREGFGGLNFIGHPAYVTAHILFLKVFNGKNRAKSFHRLTVFEPFVRLDASEYIARCNFQDHGISGEPLDITGTFAVHDKAVRFQDDSV